VNLKSAPKLVARRSLTAKLCLPIPKGRVNSFAKLVASGQYGHARIKLEPLERGSGIEIVDKTVGGVIPKEFISPALDGIREAANNGAVAATQWLI